MSVQCVLHSSYGYHVSRKKGGLIVNVTKVRWKIGEDGEGQ